MKQPDVKLCPRCQTLQPLGHTCVKRREDQRILQEYTDRMAEHYELHLDAHALMSRLIADEAARDRSYRRLEAALDLQRKQEDRENRQG